MRLAVYHVHGSGNYFLETNSQREAVLAARSVADQTDQPASVVMYFGSRVQVVHYHPESSYKIQ